MTIPFTIDSSLVTDITEDTLSLIEQGTLHIMSAIDCKNPRMGEPPPLTTMVQFQELLQVPGFQSQPILESWWMDRVSIGHDPRGRGTPNQYQQIHNMKIVGLAWRRAWEETHRYLQDKTDELSYTLEKNLDLLMGSSGEMFMALDARFGFRRFGDAFLYRVDATYSLLATVLETSGRNW